MDKETIRKAEDKCLEATKKTNWKDWVKIAVGAVIGAIAAVLTMLQTSCASSVKQVQADGSSTERTLIIDGATATQLIKLYGVPEIPTVKPAK